MTITNSTSHPPEKSSHFSVWERKRIMESSSYLADKLPYYRLSFLSKFIAEAPQLWIKETAAISRGRGGPFLSLSSPSTSCALSPPLTLWKVIQFGCQFILWIKEMKSRKGRAWGAHGCVNVTLLSFFFTTFDAKLQKLGGNKNVVITARGFVKYTIRMTFSSRVQQIIQMWLISCTFKMHIASFLITPAPDTNY